ARRRRSFPTRRSSDLCGTTGRCAPDVPVASNLSKIERREVIVDGLRPSDLLHRPVFFQKQFGRAQLAVVLEAHRIAVRTGIVNRSESTRLNSSHVKIS